MYLKNLRLKNIGPFKDVKLDFEKLDSEDKSPPVIILTGENGTGKSVIVDAIRTLLLGITYSIERDVTASENFLISSEISIKNEILELTSNKKKNDGRFETNSYDFNKIFNNNSNSKYESNFIVNYWSSKLSNDKFNIDSIKAPDPNNFLYNSLTGIHTNVEVTQLITFFEYLSDSKEEKESKVGKKMFSLIKKIINISINNGKLKHISRSTLQPIIEIKGKEVSLDKLSSGNLYLIQRLIYLLKQVYVSSMKFKTSVDEIQNTPGVLLIDEAENHLHPKWQKVFLNNILKLFPKLQLIVTTHSPFLVSSIKSSRIYVCKSQIDHSIVNEETDFYLNKPFEEILMSPLFNTSNFNASISKLLELRKVALEKENEEAINRTEKLLLEINPNYFRYLEIDELLKNLQ
jgi:predicted ATP-binding protein involved in virulence